MIRPLIHGLVMITAVSSAWITGHATWVSGIMLPGSALDAWLFPMAILVPGILGIAALIMGIIAVMHPHVPQRRHSILRMREPRPPRIAVPVGSMMALCAIGTWIHHMTTCLPGISGAWISWIIGWISISMPWAWWAVHDRWRSSRPS